MVRLLQLGTTTAAGDANGKFTVAQFGAVRVYVVDATIFQVNDTVKLFGVGYTTGAGPAATGSTDVSGRVTATGTGLSGVGSDECVDRCAERCCD